MLSSVILWRSVGVPPRQSSGVTRADPTQHQQQTLSERRATSSICLSVTPLHANQLKPPVDKEGRWVPRKEFPGFKSFGAFKCGKCGKRWTSAHSYKPYKQGCQRCETMSFPVFMWVNEHVDDDDDEDEIEDKDEDASPHDSSRCEACRLGVCDRVRY